MALECEIVAIKHKNNVDIVNSVEIDQLRSSSTFKSSDYSVDGSVFTLPINSEDLSNS